MLDGDGDPSCFRIFSWVGKDLQNSHVTAGLPYVRSREELSVRPGITMTWHGLSSFVSGASMQAQEEKQLDSCSKCCRVVSF